MVDGKFIYFSKSESLFYSKEDCPLHHPARMKMQIILDQSINPRISTIFLLQKQKKYLGALGRYMQKSIFKNKFKQPNIISMGMFGRWEDILLSLHSPRTCIIKRASMMYKNWIQQMERQNKWNYCFMPLGLVRLRTCRLSAWVT